MCESYKDVTKKKFAERIKSYTLFPSFAKKHDGMKFSLSFDIFVLLFYRSALRNFIQFEPKKIDKFDI